ncbi:MAG TPA: efflux RND transporter periplasmic adaptor subunit [Povalibacter sp.]
MKSNARQQSAAAFTEPVSDVSAEHDAVSAHSSVTRLAPLPAPAVPASGSADPAHEAGAKSTGSKRNWIIIAAVVIVGLIAGWQVLHKSAPAAPAAGAPEATAALELAAVDVVTAQPRVLSRSLPLSGSLSPVIQATVKSKVSGDVETFGVREGQDVREGDVIARVDTRNLQAQYDRELAAVDKAQADLDLAKLNRDKNRSLLEQKYISQNTYETTESAYAASVANFKLAEAQARVIKISLDDAIIRAPFAGTIARRLVQPGEKVSSDSSIVSLVDLRQLLLEASVPATEIPSVKVGQSVRFKVGGFGQREFTGEVQRINPVTNEGSRAIMIYIAVANADRALKGGMFAQGQLVLSSTQPVLSVPQAAVHSEAGVPFVYTLADGKIGRVQLAVGEQTDGSFVEVRSGLKDGERVIVADIGNRQPGSPASIRGEPTKS